MLNIFSNGFVSGCLNNKLILNLAINYGSKQEIINSFKLIAKDILNKKNDIDDISNSSTNGLVTFGKLGSSTLYTYKYFDGGERREQSSWYSLAGIKRHSDEPFWNYPNNGWHSAKDEWTLYSLDELNEHVEVLPTEWNVTELAGESSCEFLINKVKKEDVIIRHFAGGQQWRKEWFDK